MITATTLAAPTSPRTGDDKRAQLVKAAQAFEAVFVRQMIGSMRQASLGEDLFGSSGGEQFREMQDAKLADQMVADGGFGVAEMLIKQFDRQVTGK